MRNRLSLLSISGAMSLLLLLVNGQANPRREASPGEPPPLKSVCGRSHQYALELLSAPFGDLYSPMITSYFAMGIGNASGSWNTGLCWWHSRFQRAAVYLVDFAPDLPRPTPAEAKLLFRQITNFMPISVPGFATLPAFTSSYPQELEDVLSEWQRRTTFGDPGHVFGTWLTKTLTSDTETERMRRRSLGRLLDTLDAFPHPVFLMLPNRTGIHSVLVLGYTATGSGKSQSITLTTLDSNRPSEVVQWPIFVQGEFNLGSIVQFHVQFGDDLVEIERGLRTRCGADYKIPRR